MIPPAMPDDEAQRLAEVEALGLLDTEPEARFDRVTRLVARLFEVPIAYIALVDADRQWFKSSCGLEARSTSRRVSFCGHTILQDDPLVVPDAFEDPRIHDNPMVRCTPGIRFYVGHPLRGPSGGKVGTLCLADHVPRDGATVRLKTLADLAGIVEHEIGMLDLIGAQRELIATRDQLILTKRRLEEEVRHAAEYVESLIPRAVWAGGLLVQTSFTPSSELGGDFVGWVELGDGRVGAYLLDVTGHGVAASLLAVSVGHAIREALLEGCEPDPGAVLTRVNASFPMTRTGNRFVTVWLGVFDQRNDVVSYACGGHIPPLLLRDGMVAHLVEGGPPVGVHPEHLYETATRPWRHGDRLFVYSDGMFEVPTVCGAQLGIQAFEEILVTNARAGRPLGAVTESIRAAGPGTRLPDDATLLEISSGSQRPNDGVRFGGSDDRRDLGQGLFDPGGVVF